ncbi:pyrroline-5-carboxylate reductase [Rhodotorula paludigena]|uniref:pyrroline-5-carboxylate reductase n=1 Tax=Rhodotorula paludigena TaxID=86838 RepID=UPI003170B71C
MPYQLCVLGCGTMGVAVLSGVIHNLASASSFNHDSAKPEQDARPDRFIATVNRAESAQKLRKTFDALGELGKRVEVRQSADNVQSVRESDVVLLCCKPYLASHVLQADGMAAALEGKLVVSILAGTTIAQMRAWVPNSCTVVRVMTNTPARIREGMVVISSLDEQAPQTPSYRDMLLALLTPIGRCRFMDEKHFDAVTAIAGSGPAFMFLLLEAMAAGGTMMGVPPADALELAAQTMQGAARMVLETGTHPAVLKDSVTTPGGCTIAGLMSLEQDGVRGAVATCIQKTTQHAAGLGKK